MADLVTAYISASCALVFNEVRSRLRRLTTTNLRKRN